MSDLLAQLFVLSAALALQRRGRDETPNYHWLKTHWLGSRLSPSLCPAVWKCSSHIPLSGAWCGIYGPGFYCLIRTQKVRYFWGYI